MGPSAHSPALEALRRAVPALGLGLVVFVHFACSSESERTLESTTSVMDSAGGRAASADGMFEIVFEPDQLERPVSVTISTRRRFGAEGQVSGALMYEVRSDGVPLEWAVARARLPANMTWDGQLYLGVLQGNRLLPQGQVSLDPEARILQSELQPLDCLPASDCTAIYGLATRQALECPSDPCLPCTACARADPSCAPDELYCSDKACSTSAPSACSEAPATVFPGWTDTPGSGPAYVIDRLSISTENGAWSLLGGLLNDHVRLEMLGGSSLQILELAGLENNQTPDSRFVTLKWYQAYDADTPFFPANNFQIPSGETTCCEFNLSRGSLAGSPSNATWSGPARYSSRQVESVAPFHARVFLTETSSGPMYLELRGADLSGTIREDGQAIGDGRLEGVVSLPSMFESPAPFCGPGSSLCPLAGLSLLELNIASGIQPDVDLDQPPDGLERVSLGPNGRVGRCFDGDGSVVPPLTEGVPASCIARPEMADGFWVTLSFTAIRAQVVGLVEAKAHTNEPCLVSDDCAPFLTCIDRVCED